MPDRSPTPIASATITPHGWRIDFTGFDPGQRRPPSVLLATPEETAAYLRALRDDGRLTIRYDRGCDGVRALVEGRAP